MGTLTLAVYEELQDREIETYLSQNGNYWLDFDVWHFQDKDLKENGIYVTRIKSGVFLDFSTFTDERLKNQAKYYCLYSLKEEKFSATYAYSRVKKRMKLLGEKFPYSGFEEADATWRYPDHCFSAEDARLWTAVVGGLIRFYKDFFDERDELDKDVWKALNIRGIKISAAAKRQKSSMSFEEIPEYYKASVKHYMKMLIYRRSWSFCTELLVYLRYFYKSFYGHGYTDGFQEKLSRKNIEEYLGWVAEDYGHKNATFRSKAVSCIRNYLDFIQLAEYEVAPEKDMTRLIFDDDIPRRERQGDTFEKVKYIPEPVRDALDTAIDDIEPAEMKPIYILLRETGWRGTDILNLRYDQCLDYIWNGKEEEYVPYLCDEITKTGIPLHKIPVRQEVAEMVSALVAEAKARSTDDNNPDKYLFNTYEGKHKGLPYSKPAFVSAVQALIEKKEIRAGDGNIYHFKTHALRHTRALEYTEQGMPIGIIQQILGHCSLQMTLHYAKVSEDMLYKKWSETERLNLFKPDVAPPVPECQGKEEVRYEYIRKNLDAVKVPFGMCFKPTKIACKDQMQMCLECPSFCSTKDDLPEYESEIKRVEGHIKIGEKLDRADWVEKNKQYLENLNRMKDRILHEGVVHKNGKLREE